VSIRHARNSVGKKGNWLTESRSGEAADQGGRTTKKRSRRILEGTLYMLMPERIVETIMSLEIPRCYRQYRVIPFVLNIPWSNIEL
jgi:hypothetical protein